MCAAGGTAKMYLNAWLAPFNAAKDEAKACALQSKKTSDKNETVRLYMVSFVAGLRYRLRSFASSESVMFGIRVESASSKLSSVTLSGEG